MFFSGNDVYDWCRYDRKAARSYVAGLFDSAAHAAAVIDSTRNFVRIPTIVTTCSDGSRPPVPIDRDRRDGAVRCIC
jgi:hypothetical protein